MTAARPDTWMPLYVADYLADTGHLSTRQHGAYLLILMHYWRTGPLPNEPERLRRVARLTMKEWAEDGADILAFFTVTGDVLTHKRVDHELSRAKAMTEAKARAGQRGSQKRWQKDGTAIAEPSPSQWQTDAPSPSPSPSPASDEAKGERVPRRKQRSAFAIDVLPSDWRTYCVERRPELSPERTFEDFGDYYRGVGKPMADWDATWRRWVRNQRASAQPSRPGTSAVIQELRNLAEEHRGH